MKAVLGIVGLLGIGYASIRMGSLGNNLVMIRKLGDGYTTCIDYKEDTYNLGIIDVKCISSCIMVDSDKLPEIHTNKIVDYIKFCDKYDNCYNRYSIKPIILNEK